MAISPIYPPTVTVCMTKMKNNEILQCSLLAVQNTRSYSEKRYSPCVEHVTCHFLAAAVVSCFFLMQPKAGVSTHF